MSEKKKKNPGALGAAAGARTRSSDAEKFGIRNSEPAPARQGPSVYVLRLVSPRGDDIRRLRLLLKLLLRRYQLRCLSVTEEAPHA
jgi:hypothetical protein